MANEITMGWVPPREPPPGFRRWVDMPKGVEPRHVAAAWRELARDCPPPPGLYDREVDWLPVFPANSARVIRHV